MKRMRNMGRCAPLFRSMSNSGGNAAVAHWFPSLFECSCSGAALGESKQGSALQEEGDNRGRKKEMHREGEGVWRATATGIRACFSLVGEMGIQPRRPVRRA